MHRACTRLRQRNPNLFIVESLFANNEQGVWYDPSDMNTLFQDDAGTIPVTASGQTVGRILDKSGRGNHATQSSAANRPTFRDVGGLRYLEFDGANDFLITGSINFTASDAMSVFAGIRKLSDATVGMVAELSTDANTNNGSWFIAAPISAGVGNSSFQSRGTANQSAGGAATFAAPASAVITGLADISLPRVEQRRNGVSLAVNTGSQGTGNYGTYPIYIGRRAGVSIPFTGHLYGFIVRGVLSDTASINSAERYLAAKSGVTLA